MKNQKGKKSKILIILLVILLGITGVTALIGSIRQADAVRNAAPYDWDGELYDVGDKKMYAEVNGPTDAVPVVFVSGLADGAYSWCTYAPGIESSYQTITFDPAGIGQSDTSSSDEGDDSEIYDLHGLLDATGVEGPYVLVGHSRGGGIVRRYAQLFPEEVMGVVLVDATNKVMISDTLARLSYQVNKLQYDMLSITNAVGIPRLLEDMGTGLLAREIDEKIIASQGEEYLDAVNETCFQSTYISTIAGQFGSVNAILDLVEKENQPLDIPAYVLYEVPTNDPDSPVDETEEMLRLCIENVSGQFPDLQSKIVYDAGHYIHFTMPEEVTAGIEWVIAEYQKG